MGLTLPHTDKPQCLAARAYVEALHARRAGEATEAQVQAAGAALNAAVAHHGKP